MPVPGQVAVVGGAALLAGAHEAAPQPGLVTLLLVLAGAAALLRLLALGDLGHHVGADINPLQDAILNLNLSDVCFKDHINARHTFVSNADRRFETCRFLLIF